MTNISLAQFCERAYNSAKLKGFYTNNQSDDAYIAGIHSELSEAFDAWNKNLGFYIPYNGTNEPGGVIFELVDAVIRALSYCGYKGLTPKTLEVTTDRPYVQDDLCDMILRSHLELSQYYELIGKETRDDFEYQLVVKCSENIFSSFIDRIERFIVDTVNVELDKLIEMKFAYNSTRGFRHGSHKV